MELLINAFILLAVIVSLIAIYGYFKGGVDGMLEKEINHNTIDADQRIETTRYIDFFKQVKRVDSIYVNTSTQTLQIKKNNRLSLPFNYHDIQSVTLEFNDTVKATGHPDGWFQLSIEEWPDDLDAGDWSIAITWNGKEQLVLFESYALMESVTQDLADATEDF